MHDEYFSLIFFWMNNKSYYKKIRDNVILHDDEFVDVFLTSKDIMMYIIIDVVIPPLDMCFPP